MLLFLLGCPYVDEADFDGIRDADGDGFLAIRFGGDDCDDHRADIGPCDADGDGFDSLLVGGNDCDDTRHDVFPTAPERCDGIDNDCDGLVDEDGAVDANDWFRDDDDDGFGAGEGRTQCLAPEGFVERDGDCNDSVNGVRPGVPELCDAVDWNCDGDPVAGAARVWFEDADGDGYGNPDIPVGDGCTPPEHLTPVADNSDDCDDDAPLAHPTGFPADSTEQCDGIDNDCDGLFDADDPSLPATARVPLFVDADGDGFGTGAAEGRCPGDVGYEVNGGDCEDDDPLVNPAAQETCAPGDEDCDGLVDSADPDNDGRLLFPDADADGLGSVVGAARFCESGVISGFVEQAGDCNDTLPAIQGEVAWYLDLDQDGFGDDNDVQPIVSCSQQPGRTTGQGDCDDLEADTNPDADELCDQLDNDCNGVVDDGAADVVAGYLDNDGDGFGQQGTFGNYCFAAAGNDLDCDDTNSLVHPFATERCDDLDLDEDCNGLADDADPGVTRDLYYRDADLDGFGTADLLVPSCEPVPGHVRNSTDCDDTNPSKYFSSFTLTDTPQLRTDGLDVATLQAVIDSPARCPDVPTVVEIEVDEATVPVLDVGPGRDFAGLTLRDVEGDRARVCLPPASIDVSGPLRIQGVQLGFGVAGACNDAPGNTPVLQMLDAGGSIELVDSELTGFTFPQPFLQHAGDGTNDAIVISLEDVALSGLTWNAPFLDLPTAGAEVRFDKVVLDGSTANAPLVDATLDVGFPTTPRWTVALVDSQILDTDFGTDSMFSVRGGYSLVVQRSQLDAVQTTAPLFCLGSETCGSTLDPVVDPEGVNVNLQSTSFSPMPDAPLVWTAGPTNVRSVGNVYTDGTQPLVVQGDADAGATWMSLRDRFVDLGSAGAPSGMPGFAGLVAVNESHVIRSTVDLGEEATLQNTALVDSDLTVGVLTASNNVHAGATSVPYPAFGPGTAAWFLPGAVQPAACAGPFLSCAELTAPLSAYDPGLPQERWVLFPVDDQVDRNFRFGAQGLSVDELFPLSGSVPWGEDPNQDGLPAAWLVFHASSPTCQGVSGLFEPQGDPDGDQLVNVQEVTAGTWPCLSDTDGDGANDLVDAAPLDAVVR